MTSAPCRSTRGSGWPEAPRKAGLRLAKTTTTATKAGVPQVVVPQWADQPYFASRVADLGIGAAHDVQVPTIESLSAALSTALAPEARARAAAVAGAMRTDGATVAAKLLLDAAGADMPRGLIRPVQSALR
ncbi:MAG TPA: nucleotide disphospho-sugar-binding domain-containing protein [Streptosporangiaceae bacterium]|nr:nucleotide disphospho-sugar-binding domain-containing protein [Streptosporangiaceae bacterium]